MIKHSYSSRLMFVALCAALIFAFPTIVYGTKLQSPNNTDLFGPDGSGAFGTNITVLPNENIVISDPLYDAGSIQDVGAVYIYNGATLTLISVLTGSHADDKVGEMPVIVLANGNFVVNSPSWDNNSVTDVGAVTWCSGISGCSGQVSASNSLIGSTAYDWIGEKGVTALSNGNYVIASPWWNNGLALDVGAVTWCSGSVGCQGEVTSSNSLVGNVHYDDIGNLGISELTNGNYIVLSSRWDNGKVIDAGAVTWCNGEQPCIGNVSSPNSLTGDATHKIAGYVVVLANGNYVIPSKGGGAVTWCSGMIGCQGTINISNSLITNDTETSGIIALQNGNYLVVTDVFPGGGAITWCNGGTGCIGEVSSANSLIGTTSYKDGSGVTVLTNGNYVVSNLSWNNGLGAVIWCDGTSGCIGAIDESNSLVGGNLDDGFGSGGVIELTNGNYLVNSPRWQNGPTFTAGAVTWCTGGSGCKGVISPSNSLVGSYGYNYITVLANGNYVVNSPYWDNGSVPDAGAITWCDGSTGCTGIISPANSLIGQSSVTPLSNGNYVVVGRGLVFWCNGQSGCIGTMQAKNSLQVNGSSNITVLTNSNYVVNSQDGVTWCSGISGCKGRVVEFHNSLIGTSGKSSSTSRFQSRSANGIEALADGNYIVINSFWDDRENENVGAVTFGDGLTGSATGLITASNSVFGKLASSNQGATLIVDYQEVAGRLVVGFPAENRVTIFTPSGIKSSISYLPMVRKQPTLTPTPTSSGGYPGPIITYPASTRTRTPTPTLTFTPTPTLTPTP